MSTVVVFPTEKVRSAPRPDHHSAQVFIFTGVRYERLDYAPPAPPTAKPRKVARHGADVPFQG